MPDANAPWRIELAPAVSERIITDLENWPDLLIEAVTRELEDLVRDPFARSRPSAIPMELPGFLIRELPPLDLPGQRAVRLKIRFRCDEDLRVIRVYGIARYVSDGSRSGPGPFPMN